jgi:hypothetical protein
MPDFESRSESILKLYDAYRRRFNAWTEEVDATDESLERLDYFEGEAELDLAELYDTNADVEVEALYDFALYGYFKDHTRLVDIFADQKLEDSDLSADQRRFIDVVRNDRFGIFTIRRVIPGFGVFLRDYAGGEDIFCVDRSLSITAAPGYQLATRLFKPADWYMNTGSGFPTTKSIIKHLPARFRQAYKKHGGRPGAMPPAARRGLECELLYAASVTGLTRYMTVIPTE